MAIFETTFIETMNLYGLATMAFLGYVFWGFHIANISRTEFPGTVWSQRALLWPWFMSLALYRDHKKKQVQKQNSPTGTIT